MEKTLLYPSPVGALALTCEDGAVTALRRAMQPVDEGMHDALTRLVFRQLDAYFAGIRREFDVPLRPSGTLFQKAVWAALRQIPYGETRTYQDIAEAVGRPKAYRAVGMANHCNPIYILIPCHRVIGADGTLTGYGGGLDMKRALLELESSGRK